MKTKIIIILFFAILLGSCGPKAYEKLQSADYSAIEKQCQKLEGKPVSKAYELWGAPEEIKHTGKYKVLKYTDQMMYEGYLIVLKHDVFVQNDIIKICDFRHTLKK